MYGIYGHIYHQYTPNATIYTIHGSYGKFMITGGTPIGNHQTWWFFFVRRTSFAFSPGSWRSTRCEPNGISTLTNCPPNVDGWKHWLIQWIWKFIFFFQWWICWNMFFTGTVSWFITGQIIRVSHEDRACVSPSSTGSTQWMVFWKMRFDCCQSILRGLSIRHWEVPSGKLTVCYWKWPIYSWIYPWKMMIFHSYVNVYQRVNKLTMCVTGYKISWPQLEMGDQISYKLRQLIFQFGTGNVISRELTKTAPKRNPSERNHPKE